MEKERYGVYGDQRSNPLSHPISPTSCPSNLNQNLTSIVTLPHLIYKQIYILDFKDCLYKLKKPVLFFWLYYLYILCIFHFLNKLYIFSCTTFECHYCHYFFPDFFGSCPQSPNQDLELKGRNCQFSLCYGSVKVQINWICWQMSSQWIPLISMESRRSGCAVHDGYSAASWLTIRHMWFA